MIFSVKCVGATERMVLVAAFMPVGMVLMAAQLAVTVERSMTMCAASTTRAGPRSSAMSAVTLMKALVAAFSSSRAASRSEKGSSMQLSISAMASCTHPWCGVSKVEGWGRGGRGREGVGWGRAQCRGILLNKLDPNHRLAEIALRGGL